MRLGIDISQIAYQGTGVGRFTRGLVQSILDYDNQNQWTFFFSSLRQKLDPEIKNNIYQSKYTLIEWMVPPTVLAKLWNDYHSFSSRFHMYPTELNKLDYFITSDWTEPPIKTKKATIVHDLVFKKFPETVHETILHTQEKRLELIAKESSVIFADSHQTAADITSYYDISEKKITVNYPGVDMSMVRPTSQIRKKYTLPDTFILTVGKQEPRKNTERLIKAYRSIDMQHKPDLVIVGMEGWDTTQFEDPHIHYLGFIPDEDLSALYMEALFFILPSLYEGFGYPVIEAMYYGCPVAVSDSSSLAELAKGNGILFDPMDESSIKKAMISLISDEKKRILLSASGKKRAEDFNWKNYYTTLLKSLTKAV